jgi:hypothetical protein
MVGEVFVVFWYCEEEACYLRVFEIMDDVDID